VDYNIWNPSKDTYLKKTYNGRTLKDKQSNKRALLREFKLPVRKHNPLLIGIVTRLVEQKGIDLVIETMPILMDLPLQLVILGSGNPSFEAKLQQLALQYPGKLAVQIGYDEAMSHRIEAGSDTFLMPSRFEPCGLNQMYSLRYGTIPIVRRVGGLADSVTEATPQNLMDKSANGIIFDHANAQDLLWAINRTLELYEDTSAWKNMMRAGMRQRYDWKNSAHQYIEVYTQAQQLLKKG
jgi:starch synthase